MELNFPSPATTGTVYTGTNSVTYIYDGVKWQGEVPTQTDLNTGQIYYHDNRIDAQPATDIIIATNSGTWTFSSTGTIGFADGSVQNTAWTGTVSYSNITNVPTPTAVSTSTLYSGTATFSLSSDGTLTLYRGTTFKDNSNHAFAIGQNAGLTNQGTGAVALGYGAGNLNQGASAVSLGQYAGQSSQGASSIAIGAYAGRYSQPANSIVINGTGSLLAGTTGTMVVKPLKTVTTTTGLSQVWYNPTTGEFVYYTP